MGKSTTLKKYIVVSGFNNSDNNRGTAALGYGAISFLKEKGYFDSSYQLLNFQTVLKPWKYSDYEEVLLIQDERITRRVAFISKLEILLFEKFGILLPWTKFAKLLNQIHLVACINGGDGFSDIYSTPTFFSRLHDTWIALKYHIPYIILPQTLGPFKESSNYEIAKDILKKAKEVYVRDEKFISELKSMGVSYELTADLSAYMKPEAWDFTPLPHAIGINVSGLAYFNKFRALSGEFTYYPMLIERLIKHFQSKGNPVYLIPHSYNYNKPEEDNDDHKACRIVYENLDNTSNVFFVEQNLSSPQVKYVISQMSFFIGTRMHANFAAIYSNIPLFGLAYSYKFMGAFNANGLDGDRQTAMINNITADDVDNIIQKIDLYYKEVIRNEN